MKFLFVLLLSFKVFSQGHQHHAPPPDRPSVHGMLMLGSSKIYFSHLPMFHSPHDYQVFLEVEIDPAAQATYLEQAQNSPGVYMFVPEVFVLPEMIQKPRPFKGKIFMGHFERGGHVIVQEATAQIKKVLYFKKFDKLAAGGGPTHLIFGHPGQMFMAHIVGKAPDFDQIVEVQMSEVKNLPESGALPLQLPSSQPLKDLTELPYKHALGKGTLRVSSLIYLEFDDLAH